MVELISHIYNKFSHSPLREQNKITLSPLICYYYCMSTINTINFNSNAKEAFTFYKSVFGGEFAKVVRFKDISSDEVPVVEKRKINSNS